MKKLVITVTALALLLALLLWPRQADQPPAHLPTEAALRPTTTGPVVGFEDESGTYGWKGIPFAAPPVGDLRWRAPRLPEPWQEPLAAVAWRPACTQLWGPLSGIEDGEPGQVVGSEDCLYLNLWAPRSHSAMDTQPLPVMVWIHGGGNTIGTANTYPAARLAGEQNLVVVTINYRLGLFGWLSHPALRTAPRSAADASGNYGTLDMIMALKWVQNNIAFFGGDPNNVTVFGESAGGRNVYSLIFSPQAKGLFHNAIAQSGTPGTTPGFRAENFRDAVPPGAALSSREWLAQKLQQAGRAESREAAKAAQLLMSDQAVADFIYALSPTEILAGIDGSLAGMFAAPQIIRDGHVIPTDEPYALLADPSRHNSVPLITGTNKDEAKLFIAQDPEYVELKFGLLPRIRDEARYQRVSDWITHPWKALAVDEPAAIISEHGGAPVYAYRWDWDEGGSSWMADYAKLLGAAHGLEVGYLFNDFEQGIAVPGLYNDANRAGRDTLAAQMRSYWAQFARTGSPERGTDGALPEWRAWEPGKPNLMLLDTPADGGLRMVSEPMTADLLKRRLAEEPGLKKDERCAIYASLFFQESPGDVFWNATEWRELGCEPIDPWSLAAPFN